MENERSSLITIGGEQYEMVLTTRATKAISTRYGGLDNLGDKLMKSENMEMALDEIVWLITLLCNQGRHHYIFNADYRGHGSPQKQAGRQRKAPVESGSHRGRKGRSRKHCY